MRSLFLFSLSVLVTLQLATGVSAQGMPNTPECQRYMAYARGAGAPGTLGPLQQLYGACINSGRRKSRPSNVPSGSTHCGGGRYCKPGLKCASGGKCIEKDVADCGKGQFCSAGNKCAKQGGCLPKDAVDCGSFSCGAGNVCAANNKCVTEAHALRLRGGGPLDAKTARDVRSHVAVASSAVLGSRKEAAKRGFQSMGDWDAILAKNGKSKADIAEWRKAGFGAAVYRSKASKSGSRQVIIAFKGPEPRKLEGEALRDWIKTNWPRQTTGEIPAPYQQAADFAKAVQQQMGPGDTLAVTGFSLGGTLAAFVGNLLKVEATTFNAPTTDLAPLPKLQEEAKPNQTNIITAGDPVSDPLANPDETKLATESSPLPGLTFVVEPKNAKDKPHELTSIVKYVEELAKKEKGKE